MSHSNVQAKYSAKPLMVRLKPEVHEWLKAQAEAQERSVNWLVNAALDRQRLQQEQAGAAQ